MIVGNYSKEKEGFTLIELLVTITVAIILVTIAVPSFQNLVAENRHAADVNEVLASLHYSRNEAVKRRENVRLEIFDDAGRWVAEIRLSNEESEALPLRVVKSRHVQIQASPGYVVFNSSGGVEAGGCEWDGCVIIITGGRQSRVQISVSGRPYLLEEQSL